MAILDTSFCASALDWALARGQPEIFNSDQGGQFTSEVFTDRLQARGILISMDGRGRVMHQALEYRTPEAVYFA